MTTVSMHGCRCRPPGEDVVLGVDTHKDIHVAAVLTLTGGVIAPRSAAATRQD
uniref:hypothetical protein n=1 Tax=Actinomadura sp. CA-154981 TaxID=3240037 RepID=UPI003F49762A